MKTAYLLHGICDEEEFFRMDFPSPSNAHWLPWLQQKFLRSGVLCQTLEMPTPYAPEYGAWKAVWERQELGRESVVVGHSAGGGFILKWLAENQKVKLSKLVLVAPWRDPAREMGDFVDGELDAEVINRVGEMHIFISADDMETVVVSVDEIMRVYPGAKVHRFTDKGHFCWGDLGGGEFGELWDVCRTV